MTTRARQSSPRAAPGRLCLAMLAALVAPALAGCEGVQSGLSPAGPQAARLASLFWLFTWICAGVFVLVLSAAALATFRRRARPRTGAAEPPVVEPPPHVAPEIRARLQPPDEAQERRASRLIALATAASAAILVALVVVSALSDAALAAFQPANAVEVNVVARQWWWEFRYPAQPPSDSVVTANELHVPVGRAVKLRLEARDVIHSFWVPRLHGKLDLIPGRTNEFWLQADEAGAFRGQCAEFCGAQHARMAFWVVAEPETQFQGWLSHQRQPAAGPQTADQKQGRQVFLSRGCPLCHAVNGTGAAATAGPDLTHVASRRRIATYFPNDAEHLARWVSDPQDLKPGTKMPPSPLPPEELRALSAYLESLR